MKKSTFKSISIGIAEDHDMVRHGFVGVLNAHPDIRVLFEVRNGRELLETLKEFKPEIILLDIAMPEVDGIKAMGLIKQYFSGIKIIVITAYYDEPSIIQYARMGANSVLPKNCKMETLVSAIFRVHKQGSYFDDNTLKLLNENDAFPSINGELTESEVSVLKHLIANKSESEIAGLMKVSERTINWHKRKLFIKTNSKDVIGLIAYAEKNQLV